MPTPSCPAPSVCATPSCHGRAEEVVHLYALAESGQSQREYAEASGVPRSTLSDWVRRQRKVLAEPEVVAFFESPAGLRLLTRIVVAALVVMTLHGSCGLSLVTEFFVSAGLSPFVASSYGSLYRTHQHLLKLVMKFDTEQRAVLGQAMRKKEVSLCEDETFLASGMVLVAMEPASGFVVAERFSEQRTGQAWNEAVEQGLAGLNVAVVSQHSDEAKGLLRHAKDQGIPHFPDLFHVDHDVCQALGAKVGKQLRDAEKSQDKAALSQATVHYDHFVAGLGALGQLAHPFDLETGQARTEADCLAGLCETMDGLDEVGHQVGVSQKGKKKLAKARKQLPALARQVDWYHQRVSEALDKQEVDGVVAEHIRRVLLPVAYLRHIAKAAPEVIERDLRLQLADQLEAGAVPVLDRLSQAEQERLHSLVAEWATWFCRGSSCVEGRNGVLSLHHHARRHLSQDKLTALTVVHNFLITRPDGTTAANRFFEREHPDLFLWLLDRMPPPSRPAKPRPNQATNRKVI